MKIQAIENMKTENNQTNMLSVQYKSLAMVHEACFTVNSRLSPGLSQVEKKRFESLTTEIQRLGIIGGPAIARSLTPFSLKYSFPKCPEAKELLGKFRLRVSSVVALKCILAKPAFWSSH